MNSRIYTLHYKNENLKLVSFIRPGNNKTLLYLHGGACSSEDFLDATKREELKSYTIVRFDFPGCGESSYPEHAQLDIDDLVEITRNIIQNLDLHTITLIGHSMGGLVVLKYIVKYGDIDEFNNKTWQELKRSLQSSKKRGFQKWARTLEKASAKAFYDYCVWIVKNCDDPNTFNEYLNLKIPHLYMYGSENRDSLTFLKKFKVAQCKTAEISNSNHFPFYDNPEEFYDVLAEFLSDNCRHTRGFA